MKSTGEQRASGPRAVWARQGQGQNDLLAFALVAHQPVVCSGMCIDRSADALPSPRAGRSSHPQLSLPPLLRGQTWWLRYRCERSAGTSSNDARPSKTLRAASAAAEACGHLPDASGEAALVPSAARPRPACSAGSESPPPPTAYTPLAVAGLEALVRQGPLEGSMAKFKLVCYTNRTFVFRNLGTPLARGAVDMARYQSSVAQLLSSALFNGMPASSKAALHDLAKHWGQWILALSQGERSRLAKGYLTFYRQFMQQVGQGWRVPGSDEGSMARAPEHGLAGSCAGLYIIVSPHPEVRQRGTQGQAKRPQETSSKAVTRRQTGKARGRQRQEQTDRQTGGHGERRKRKQGSGLQGHARASAARAPAFS